MRRGDETLDAGDGDRERRRPFDHQEAGEGERLPLGPIPLARVGDRDGVLLRRRIEHTRGEFGAGEGERVRLDPLEEVGERDLGRVPVALALEQSAGERRAVPPAAPALGKAVREACRQPLHLVDEVGAV